MNLIRVTNLSRSPYTGEITTSQLLNVYRVSDVRQIEIPTAEQLVPDPSPFEVEIAIAKMKSYKSSCSD
jgi:hypothetical protein